MTHIIKRFLRDESGATAVEYGLITSLVAMALVTALTEVGTNLSQVFQNIADTLN